MTVNEIKDGDLILARHIPSSAAWAGGLNFFSPDRDYQQVGTWNYDQGKQLLPHAHNEVARTVLWTQEVLYIRSGKIKATIFDTGGKEIAELVVKSGDVLVLLLGGHGYEILENGTQVLEIKNGPYVGADADRKRF